MNRSVERIDKGGSKSLNVTFAIKRAIRLALANSSLSRDQVVDRMNELAAREGLKKSVSKAAVDGWTKDSDLSRLPSLPWIVIFCKVLENADLISTIAGPLDLSVVDERGKALLDWAEAELARQRATRRAEVAFETIKDI